MIVDSQLFGAYLECSTKCWLQSRGEPTSGNSYAEWARLQNETYLKYGLKRSFTTIPASDRVSAPPDPQSHKTLNWSLAIDARWATRELGSRLQAVERVSSQGTGRRSEFIPYRFEFANRLAKQHMLLLAFDAILLSEVLGRDVTLGKIVHGDSYVTRKVKIPDLASEVRTGIIAVTALLANNSPPDLVLTRHCGQCEFKLRCRTQAKEKDDISLLSGISQKERLRLHSKGIFTVTQLSYTFRPRRRRGESRSKEEKYHHSLRALSVRENKIHVVGLPDVKFGGTPVFLDVEGLPDRDFYYLIGVRVLTAEGSAQHSFWAGDPREEKLIWSSFLDLLSEIMNPQLFHYGSYETNFLKRMRQRHGGPHAGTPATAALDRATNLLSFVYARVYFPTFSNGLKEIAEYLGFQWSGSLTSGLQTIVLAPQMGGIQRSCGEAGASRLQRARLRGP